MKLPKKAGVASAVPAHQGDVCECCGPWQGLLLLLCGACKTEHGAGQQRQEWGYHAGL